MKKINAALAVLLSLPLVLSGCTAEPTDSTQLPAEQNETVVSTNTPLAEKLPDAEDSEPEIQTEPVKQSFNITDIPAYSGKPYVSVNNNIPFFTESDMTEKSFEKYSSLDSLGRCGVAFANIGVDIMPTEERGSIGMVKPSGWQTVKYENVSGKYLYNRCHLIGFQLSGENANEKNLITGTRSMNINGMLPFENMVADYVKETENHVLLRVTPVFEGKNLVATGVLMEGYSVEDDGDGICFNVFCYNSQPGIEIDYSDGSSKAEDGSAPYGSSAAVSQKSETSSNTGNATSYIGNKNSKKFHYPYCHSVDQMSEKNKVYMTCTRSQAISNGYSPCGNCNP